MGTQVHMPAVHCTRVQAENPLPTEECKVKLKSQLNLSQKDLTTEQYKQLEGIIWSNGDVFALSEEEVGQTLLVTHKIDTKEHPAIKQQPRHTPFVHREKIIQLLNEMLNKSNPTLDQCLG